MIKSTKCTLKFLNTKKLDDLSDFIDEYQSIVLQFIDLLWSETKVPILLPKQLTSKIKTKLTKASGIVQCAGKQASGIVRGVKQKQLQRKYMIDKLNSEGKFKQARKIAKIYNVALIAKPVISHINPELYSRFVKIELNNQTSFDGWLTLKQLGSKQFIKIPFKRHKHFNELSNKGTLKTSIRVSKKEITFLFDIPESKQKIGTILGIDIGQNTTLSCSDGTTINKDPHGHTFQSICQKLSRKKKGSKAFKKAQNHRTNYLNWCVNQLDLTNVGQVNREDIKYLRKGKRLSRYSQHWNYSELFDSLDSKLIDAGVQINKLDPHYTSQRCSKCGWVCERNRQMKIFKCVSCSYEHDADLNASFNLSFDLVKFSPKQLKKLNSKTGFYWKVNSSKAPIVPYAQRTNIENLQ